MGFYRQRLRSRVQKVQTRAQRISEPAGDEAETKLAVGSRYAWGSVVSVLHRRGHLVSSLLRTFLSLFLFPLSFAFVSLPSRADRCRPESSFPLYTIHNVVNSVCVCVISDSSSDSNGS